MELLKFLQRKNECTHSKVSPQDDLCYCPDCGELIENQWFITRCTCCGIKIKALYKNGEVVPSEKFCHNCGSNIFEAELVPKINCIDINYAVLVKTVVSPKVDEQTQSWFDTHYTQKLLTQT